MVFLEAHHCFVPYQMFIVVRSLETTSVLIVLKNCRLQRGRKYVIILFGRRNSRLAIYVFIYFGRVCIVGGMPTCVYMCSCVYVRAHECASACLPV